MADLSKSSTSKRILLPDSQPIPWRHAFLKAMCLLVFFGYPFSSASDGSVSIRKLPETPPGYYQNYVRCYCGPISLHEEIEPPESYTIEGFSPVKSQGPLGTCVSFTITGGAEYLYKEETFSEAEFTILAQTNEDVGHNCQGGLFLGKALKLAQQYGLVLKKNFPSYKQYLEFVARKNDIDLHDSDWRDQLRNNEDASLCNTPSKNGIKNYNDTLRDLYEYTKFQNPRIQLTGTEQDYTHYKLATAPYVIHHVTWEDVHNNTPKERYDSRNLSYSLSRLSLPTHSKRSQRTKKPERKHDKNYVGTPGEADIQSVKNALYCNIPVAAAVNVYGNWENPSQGIIPMPKDQEITGEDSHAIVLIGFDDGQKIFEFKNSWGEEWGNSGYGYLPYNYVRKYATELIAMNISQQTIEE